MGHLINGNHFHPSTLREGIIIVLFFSLFFSSWVGVEVGDIKYFTLYFLTSPGAQAPFGDGARCNETFTSKGFRLPTPPCLEGDLLGILDQSEKFEVVMPCGIRPSPQNLS